MWKAFGSRSSYNGLEIAEISSESYPAKDDGALLRILVKHFHPSSGFFISSLGAHHVQGLGLHREPRLQIQTRQNGRLLLPNLATTIQISDFKSISPDIVCRRRYRRSKFWVTNGAHDLANLASEFTREKEGAGSDNGGGSLRMADVGFITKWSQELNAKSSKAIIAAGSAFIRCPRARPSSFFLPLFA